MRFRELTLRKDPDCPVCGTHPTIRELEELAEYCTPADGHDEDMMTADDMTVLDLKARMDAGTAPLLIDVREPHEHQICQIPGATLIPMNQVPARLGEFDPSAEIVVHCRSGARSAQVVAFMRQKGFTNAHNLAGGVLAWIDQVDPSQPKY
jgi:sulfur-carrier protein adenylyltransferase/sulfurtransferase